MAAEHDEIADRLAKKLGTEHRRKGVDIIKDDTAIEVAVEDSDIYSSLSQLRRSRKDKLYLSVPTKKIAQAKEVTKGTGIGVMGPNGKIHKRTRKK